LTDFSLFAILISLAGSFLLGRFSGIHFIANLERRFDSDFAQALDSIERVQKRVLEDLDNHPAQAQS
jgi:hypothetical protein